MIEAAVILSAAALVAVIIAVVLFRGDPMLTTLQFAPVLAVAGIPVAMPTVLSVTMAVGALARQEKKPSSPDWRPSSRRSTRLALKHSDRL